MAELNGNRKLSKSLYLDKNVTVIFIITVSWFQMEEITYKLDFSLVSMT